MSAPTLWTDKEWDSFRKTAAKHTNWIDACAEHNKRWGLSRSPNTIKAKVMSKGIKRVRMLLAKTTPARRRDDIPVDGLIENLCRKLKRRPAISFSDLCDEMEMAPKFLKEVIAEARSRGRRFRSPAPGQISLETEAPVPDRLMVRRLPIEPVRDHIRFVAMSDTHYGSLQARPECIQDALEIAYYDYKVRRVFHNGDVFDGLHVYRGQITELKDSNMGAQVRTAQKLLPRFKGMKYDIIGGNHDEDSLKDNGYDAVGELAKSRDDVRAHGYYSALLDIGPERRPNALKAELFHPGGGVPYARSYPLQKAIEKIPAGMKPHILMAGHLHYEFTMTYRGVFGIQVPCFQDQTLLGRRMGAAPEIGLFIVDVGITRSGSPKSITHTRLQYFHAARGPIRCKVVDRNGDAHEKRFERRLELN